MAVKDVNDYYLKVTKQYLEMQRCLEEATTYCETHTVAPEFLDNLKATIEPIKNNYLTISYIMYLLNKPVKRSSQARYKDQSKKQLSHSKSLEEVIAEDQKVLDKLKDFTKDA